VVTRLLNTHPDVGQRTVWCRGPAEHVEAAPTSCETADAVRHAVGVSELHCRAVPEARDLAVQRFVRTSFASGSATVLAAAATSPPGATLAANALPGGGLSIEVTFPGIARVSR